MRGKPIEEKRREKIEKGEKSGPGKETVLASAFVVLEFSWGKPNLEAGEGGQRNMIWWEEGGLGYVIKPHYTMGQY